MNVKSGLFVSGAEFTRDMRELIRGAHGCRTIAPPKILKRVCEYAFECIDSLASVILNDGLEEICEEAFSKNGLKRVELPPSLVNIAQNAFSHCFKLKSVYIGKSTIDIERYVNLSVKVLPTKGTLVAG